MSLLTLIMMAMSMRCVGSRNLLCGTAEYEVLFLSAMPLYYVASLRQACSPAEYQVMGECCPMCNPGYHVFRHCTEYTSTTCTPCPQTTYTEAHNGLESCKTCTVCDSSAGVRVKRNCTPSSDTLCEPLEGHYCTDPIKDGCQGAVEHTKCNPGLYIREKGSASSDTLCSDCDSETYSDGSFTSCRPHKQCKPGYDVVKPGSSASDTECQTTSTVFVSVGVVGAILVVTAVGATVWRMKPDKKKTRQTWERAKKGKARHQQEVISLASEPRTVEIGGRTDVIRA